MADHKESKWKKKGFYLSVCTALICLLAVGTVYYKMNSNSPMNQNKKNDVEQQEKTAKQEKEEEKKNTLEAANNSANQRVKKLEELKRQKRKEEERKRQALKEENEKKQNVSASNQAGEKKEQKTSVTIPKRTFDEEKGLLWPVSGNILLKYSMKNTIYFKTLAQYKCNPAIEIAAKVGTTVKSAAAGTVTSVAKEDEMGKTVSVNIGDGYILKYGQLKDVSVQKGQSIKEGQTIGKIAKPTAYFSKEGANLYFQVTQDGKSVDPMLLLR